MDEERQSEETEETENTDSESQPKKKGLKLPFIIGIVVVILLLGGGGYFLYNHLNSTQAVEGEEEEEVEIEEISETNIYYEGFQTNVVNLAVSDEYEFMYLKYGLYVEVSEAGVISELGVKLPRLNAKVAGVMSNRDWNEICTPQGRDRLAREAMGALNEELRDGQVIGVYFGTFVAQ